jgi:23S rRNA pseudouridine2605 synthase
MVYSTLSTSLNGMHWYHMPPRRQPQRRSPAKHGALRRTGAAKPRPATADGEHPTSQTGDRLQKVLALAGVASRRECEELIREGRVEVDHKVVTELGTRVDPLQQEIRVDGEALSRPRLVYFAVNKPNGYVATARDPAGRPRVTDLMPPNTPRVFCVGRLDMASEGLILVTNDGDLANGLTHPRHGVEKVYHVQVAGQVEQDVLGQLHRGIHLAEGFAHVKHVRIKSRKKQSTILEMVLDEGRNREVRRLLARVGHKVQRLKRIAVGPVRLGDLPTGAVRPLTKKEVESLQMAIARGPSDKSRREDGPKPSRAPQAKPKTPQPRGKKPKDERTIIG